MGKVYFEFQQVGAYMKVTAVDAQTGAEVSIVGDPKASQKELETVARNKLSLKLEKGRGIP